MESSELVCIDALIQFYFHIDTKDLSDDEFAMKWNQLKWLLKNGHPKFTFKNG